MNIQKQVSKTATRSLIAAMMLAGTMTSVMASSALAADPIIGTWARPNGTLEIITKCGNAFCVTVGSGKYKGKKAGSMKRQADGSYKGKLTELRTGISFSGTGKIKGNKLHLSALMGLRKEVWTRK